MQRVVAVVSPQRFGIAGKGKRESNSNSRSNSDADSNTVHRYAQCHPDASPDSDAGRQRLSA